LIRTKYTYFDKISTKAVNTQKTTIRVINKFEEFCKERYAISLDQLKYEDIVDVLQTWINLRHKQGIMPSTIQLQFTHLNQFLYYIGIKLFPQDIKNELTFPKKTTEETMALQIGDIHQLFKYCKGDKQALYLALISSGMRIGEAVQIKKKDLNFTMNRIMIKIPSACTKTKTARTTFLSKEAAMMISPKLKQITDNDLVWGKNYNAYYSSITESKVFNSYCKKAGLGEIYESNKRMKITLHTFRAYFFTKAARCHDENYAHKMTGHGGYLMQYDRLTDEEKLEMYIELEPDLLIYDQTKNEEKIRKLKEANTKLSDQAEELKEQAKRIKNLERIWLDSNYPNVNRKSQV